MAYTTPNFNLLASVWNAGNTPFGGAADYTGVTCQFYIYSRDSTDIQPCELELYTPVIQIRLPVAAGTPWVNGQVFEVEEGSGRYYRARFKERVHYGFPNEYLVVIVVQCNALGQPLIRDVEGAAPCPPPGEGLMGSGDDSFDVAFDSQGSGLVF